jgi:hypothetical protein
MAPPITPSNLQLFLLKFLNFSEGLVAVSLTYVLFAYSYYESEVTFTLRVGTVTYVYNTIVNVIREKRNCLSWIAVLLPHVPLICRCSAVTFLGM